MSQEKHLQSLRFAYSIALNSPDPSTQNGAVLLDGAGRIVGLGWNDFTKGMEVTADLLERPKKYTFIEHAERNAIYSNISISPDLGGRPVTMVAAWASCADCARAIVQSGIKTLVRHKRPAANWADSIRDGDLILEAGGVEIIDIEGEIGYCSPVLANGELFTP